MTSRINYVKHASSLQKSLLDLSMATHELLETSIIDLVNIRVSQLNGCAFCVDMHNKEAKIHGERELRLYHVAVWRESNLFSKKERAALEWAESLTQLDHHSASDELFRQVSEVLSESELAGLTFVVGAINVWNRLNIASPKQPGELDKLFGLEKAGLN